MGGAPPQPGREELGLPQVQKNGASPPRTEELASQGRWMPTASHREPEDPGSSSFLTINQAVHVTFLFCALVSSFVEEVGAVLDRD